MHGLVHPHALGDEPVVDRAQRLHHPTVDPGLLADLAAGRRLDRLARLHVPLREHPLQRALAGTTSDQHHLLAACAGVVTCGAGASRTTRPPAEVSASVGSGRRPRRADRPAEGRDTARWYERRTPGRSPARRVGGENPDGAGPVGALPLLPVPAPTGPDDAEADQRRLTAAQQRAVAELVRVAPVVSELAERFAAAGHELSLVGGTVRDALLGRRATTSTSPPTPGPTQARAARRGLGRRGVGHRHRVRHGGAASPGRTDGDHDVPRRRLRPRLAQPRRRVRRHDRGRPACAATSASTRWR